MGNYFVTDWGMFVIPHDVPRHFRKDGWFDHRYRRTVTQVKAYFRKQAENLRDQRPIQTFAEFKASV